MALPPVFILTINLFAAYFFVLIVWSLKSHEIVMSIAVSQSRMWHLKSACFAIQLKQIEKIKGLFVSVFVFSGLYCECHHSRV